MLLLLLRLIVHIICGGEISVFILELHSYLRVVCCVILGSLEGVLAGTSRCLLLRTPTLALGRPNIATANITCLLFPVCTLVLADKRRGVQGGLSAIAPHNCFINPLKAALTRYRYDRVLRTVRNHGLDLQRVL